MTLSPEYQAYLKSPEWQAKRREALAYYGHKCAVCDGRRRLQVHHLTYDRIGHELMSDFRILCWRHHKKGRYTASQIASDATADWWVRLIDRLVTGVFRAFWWMFKLLWRFFRLLYRRLRRVDRGVRQPGHLADRVA